ncbi:redoxin domain-containing protein [Tessaracoccus sp. MC1627]|uniref:redoxin domain-containing protein n=1 Tax=Tessaracoccus sp. MC1627 TaxID=2760312 RepID=UPI0016047E4F|nr:redoxin domain-containing protein [Tessaracoccus sp. MC1627]
MNRFALVAALVLTLFAGACAAQTTDAGTSSAETSPASPAVSAQSSPAGSTEESAGTDSEESPVATSSAPSAPAASLAHLAVTTLDGGTFDPATIEGQPVILWFWAPWCTVCRAEAPHINEVVAELDAAGSPVTLIGVPGRGEVPEMEDFLDDTATGALTHLVDSDGALWREYGVVYQPAFALLSPDGEVEVINGALGADGLREAAAKVGQG